MPELKKKYGLILTMVLAVIFTFIFYGSVVLASGHFFFGSSGDGIKNYFTYASYISNNTSYTNFEGMNYPYGEHFFYTDCHPLPAFLLKALSELFPGIGNSSVGILNYMMLLSLVITAIILYLIFICLNINVIIAVAGSLAIMVLSPQTLRMTSHYALSYSFFIPLTIYLLILYEKYTSKKYAYFLALSNLFWFMVHAYLGMIAISILFVYLLVRFISDAITRRRMAWIVYIMYIIAVFVPVIIFVAIVKLTDTHIGRTTNPWGFFEYQASFSTVFLPMFKPLYPIIMKSIPGVKQGFEGMAYIGLVSSIFLLLYLVVSVKGLIQRIRSRSVKAWIESREIKLLLITAVILLFFSMGYPFKGKYESLLNDLEIIKQFRSVGRFAWVFYFVTGICSVIILDKLSGFLIHRNHKWVAIILIILASSFMIWEGIAYHRSVSKSIARSPNLFNKDMLEASLAEATTQIDAGKYQAIIPMPFYHIGSANNQKAADNKIYRLSMIFSYHLNLPIFGSYLTRISIPESKNMFQLFSENFYKKEIKDDLTSDKPFLIVYSKDQLTGHESRYLQQSGLLFEQPSFALFEIVPEKFFSNTAKEEIDNFAKIENGLFEVDGFKTNDTTTRFFHFGFEENPCEISYRGDGACSGQLKNYNTLATLQPQDFAAGVKYTACVWVYNNGFNFGQDNMFGIFYLQKRKDGVIAGPAEKISLRSCFTIDNDWSLVQLDFIPEDNLGYDFIIKGDDRIDNELIADDLLVYKTGSLIYRIDRTGQGEILFKNNHSVRNTTMKTY
jgi:hypothetical protein